MIQRTTSFPPLSKRLPPRLLILLALAGLQGGLNAQFVRERTIDLQPLYGPGSGDGTFPTALDFDGTRAFLAGFNAEAEPKGIRVRILSGLREGQTLEVVSSIQLMAPPFTGFADVAYLPGTDSAYASWVGGSAGCALLRIDAGTGALAAEFGTGGVLLGPSAKLPVPMETLALDPGFPPDAPAAPFPILSGLTLGDPQRFGFDPVSGALLYGPPPAPVPGMPVSVGAAPELRDHAYDPATGDVWVREGNGVTRSTRDAENGVAANEAGAGWFASLVTADSARGRRMAFVPAGYRLDAQPWLLVNDLPGDGTGGDRLYIARADGSTGGLPQLFLDGSEQGGTPWGEAAGALSAAAALDPAGSGDVLLAVLASEALRLDLYRATPSVIPEWQPVQILTIAPDGAGGLVITWEPGPGPFTVEAADAVDGPFATIATGLTADRYVVAPAEAHHLFYRVFTGAEPGPAEAPELTAIRAAAGAIELVWTPETGLFDVERGPAPDGPWTGIAAGLTANSYIDPAPLAGAAFYRVLNRAGGGGGEPVPVPISGYSLSASGRVVLSWVGEAGARYRVERAPALGGPYEIAADSIQGESWEDPLSDAARQGFYRLWRLP